MESANHQYLQGSKGQEEREVGRRGRGRGTDSITRCPPSVWSNPYAEASREALRALCDEYQSIGVSEDWSVGVSECQNVRVSSIKSIRVSKYQRINISKQEKRSSYGPIPAM